MGNWKLRTHRLASCLALALLFIPDPTEARSSDRPSQSADCQVIALAWSPGWVTSGVWRSVEGRSQLLVADVGRDTLLSFSEDGELLRMFRHYRDSEAEGSSLGTLARPVAVRPAAGASFWVFDEGREESFSRLDVLQNRLEQRTLSDGRPVGKIFDWAPFDSERILALAWLPRTSDGSGAEEGAYSIVLLGPEGIEQHWDWIEDTTSENWELQLFQYTFALPSVATLEGRGFVLLAHLARPTIIELLPGIDAPRVLDQAPLSEEDARPRLHRDPSWLGDRRLLENHRQLEDSSMAVSLFSHRDSLFLIKKEAAEGAARDTRWVAHRLDPDTGREAQRLELPTTAPHLTLVPGNRWALIEKGPAQRLGGDIWGDHPFLPTHSMVLVPHAWFLDPSAAGACH